MWLPVTAPICTRRKTTVNPQIQRSSSGYSTMRQGCFYAVQHDTPSVSGVRPSVICCSLQLSLSWASLWYCAAASSAADMPAKQTSLGDDPGIAGYFRGTRAAHNVNGGRPSSSKEAHEKRQNLSVPKRSCCCSVSELLLQQLVPPLVHLQQCSNTKIPRDLDMTYPVCA